MCIGEFENLSRICLSMMPWKGELFNKSICQKWLSCTLLLQYYRIFLGFVYPIYKSVGCSICNHFLNPLKYDIWNRIFSETIVKTTFGKAFCYCFLTNTVLICFIPFYGKSGQYYSRRRPQTLNSKVFRGHRSTYIDSTSQDNA